MNEQEDFWAGQFGYEYTKRNDSEKIVDSNIDFFSKALNKTSNIKTVMELGCNNGMNLLALEYIDSSMLLSGVDINARSLVELENNFIKRGLEPPTTYKGSASDPIEGKYDLVISKGLLIHVYPDDLPAVYKNLYNLSSKYILIAEYYNPIPVEIPYRGYTNRLWKRDFAGEMISKYQLKIIDYGFVYHLDDYPQDDLTWFLLSKE